MIIAHLADAARYAGVHTRFAEALAFLRRADLAALSDGRCPIDGDQLFALVSRSQGRGAAGARYEAHRRYLDIQYVVAGEECIGWNRVADCQPDAAGYDPQRDIVFFTDPPGNWTRLPPGTLAVYFPEDAHAPLAGEGPVHKVVVKIAV